ncbi:Glutamyl/glutaminyl-tRNA synthetase, class Ic, partial [mine drainage metagenome]
KHLFFVSDPIKVTIRGAFPADIKIKLHPSNDLGFREYSVDGTFYIAKEDEQNITPGDIVRLKDLMDIKIISKDGELVIAEKSEGSSKNNAIQWVPGSSHTECTVLIPENPVNDKDEFNPNSLRIVKGFAEGYVNKLKEHEIIQFERFGYCILEQKGTDGIHIHFKVNVVRIR